VVIDPTFDVSRVFGLQTSEFLGINYLVNQP